MGICGKYNTRYFIRNKLKYFDFIAHKFYTYKSKAIKS